MQEVAQQLVELPAGVGKAVGSPAAAQQRLQHPGMPFGAPGHPLGQLHGAGAHQVMAQREQILRQGAPQACTATTVGCRLSMPELPDMRTQPCFGLMPGLLCAPRYEVMLQGAHAVP